MLGLLGLAGPLLAQQPDWTDLSARRQTDGIRSVEADVTYVAGELEVFAADPGLLYDIGLRYDASRLVPERTWSVTGSEGRLKLGFETAGDEVDWNWDDGEFGRLRLGLSPDVPTALKLEVGAAEAKLELGGIPLSRLVYHTGASATEMNFGARNPVRMERMELAAGAAEFRATGLGHAGFDSLEFEGAVGDVTLDFTGDWRADAEARISVGLGALHLVLPRDVGVQIQKTGILAGMNPRGMEKVDGGWQTENWGSAPYRLRIHVKAAFGKVDVEFED